MHKEGSIIWIYKHEIVKTSKYKKKKLKYLYTSMSDNEFDPNLTHPLHTSSEHTQAGFRSSGSVMGIGYLTQRHPSPEGFKPA